MTIQTLLKRIKNQNPKADLNLVRSAYNFAKEAHRGQKRLSGERYIQHPLATANNLVEFGLDDKIIAAGLLHDVPEDTKRTIKDIEKKFGKEIAFLVAGATKLEKIKYRGIKQYIENLRRMFLVMAEDIRIILIKFADRIHNLNTLDALSKEKQKRIALETLEIYAPIANRLGMGELKGILEDLSFPYILPKEHAWLLKEVAKRFSQQKKYLEEVKRTILRIILKENIKAVSIHERPKHLYSLYQKLLEKDMDFEKIHDLITLRIIVPRIKDCYTVLGVIHKHWKPLKGKIKDYIATPKPNGYQSLHTTVFCLDGKLVEFQIRTPAMHELAEFGFVSHWRSPKQKSDSRMPDQLSWIKDLIKIQKEIKGQKQYLESIKVDIFQNRIFIFTPKGDVIDLPKNSTPIDFAYHVHTDIGNKCSGVKVNEKKERLDTKLKSGDMVEIIIDKNRKRPRADWLDLVKTHHAKQMIRYYLKRK